MNSNPPTPDGAGAALAEVERRRRQVGAAGHVGRRILLTWAVLALVTLPLFDYLSSAIAGTVLAVAAVLFAAFVAPAAMRRRVVARGGTRRYVVTAVLASAWYVLLVVAAATVARRLPHVWTAAGVLAALPFAAGALVDRTR